MKRIIAITLSAVLMFALFTACGKKEDDKIKDDVKDEITSMENDMSEALTEGKNDVQDFAEDLTENGNVTNETGEGMLEEAITDLSEMLEGDNKDTTKDTTEGGNNTANDKEEATR